MFHKCGLRDSNLGPFAHLWYTPSLWGAMRLLSNELVEDDATVVLAVVKETVQ